MKGLNMLKVWLLTCIFEVINLWSKGVQVLDIARILTVFFILALPFSIIIFKVGIKLITRDYSGVKIKLLIGLSMSWIILSAYIINNNIWVILKTIRSFV